jgi:hypothetical protein
MMTPEDRDALWEDMMATGQITQRGTDDYYYVAADRGWQRPAIKTREPVGWRDVVFVTLVIGTFVGAFFYQLVDGFSKLRPGDPFEVLFIAPLGLLSSAAIAFMAAASVAVVLRDAFYGQF